MLAFVIQSLLCVCAGVTLFLLWRRTVTGDRWIDVPIAVGLAARAIVGQALFWTSWAQLPFGRSLQLGNGFWFFATDGFSLYYPVAASAAHNGLAAIAHVPRGVASVSFVQALATSMLVFGDSAASGLLLNLFCFIGTMYLIVRWAGGDPSSKPAARVAIVAIALSPALLIWSVQPLKDTMFQFLVVAAAAACAAWQRSWLDAVNGWRRIASGAAMVAATYLLAGMRWYFAFVLIAGAGAFVILVAAHAAHRRAAAFASGAALLFFVSRAFLWGGGPYIPDAITNVLSFRSASATPQTPSKAASASELPSSVVSYVDGARDGFERVGGATHIMPAAKRAAAAPAPSTTARPVPPHASAPSSAAIVEKTEPAASRREKAAVAHDAPSAAQAAAPVESRADATPATTTVITRNKAWTLDTVKPRPPAPVVTPQPAIAATATAAPQHPVPRGEEKPAAAAAHPTPASPPAAAHASSSPAPAPAHAGSSPAPAHAATATAAPPPSPAVEPPTTAVPAQAAADVHRPSETAEHHADRQAVATPAKAKRTSRKTAPPLSAGKRITTTTAAVPATSPAVVPPPAAVAAAPVAPPPAASTPAPQSRAARLAVGTAAVLVPRSIGQRVGLFEIGGGRNLLWLTDIDTIIFDAFVLAALLWVIRSRWSSLLNPVFCFIAAVTVLIAVPLIYTVTNFGTLFRLREMIYLGVVLIPLALSTSTRRRQPPQAVPSS